MALAIRKLEEHIGAEVEGVDITAPVDASIFAQLRSALYQNSVLVFRGQNINDEQHVAFTRGFGPIELTIPNDPIGDGGPVGILSNLDENGAVIPPQDTRMLYQRGNELWHSDGAFRRVPLRASLLSAKVVPPEGGETEYAGLCAAYATLPAERRAGLEGLAAEHNFAKSRAQIAPNLVDDAFLEEVPPVEHALVRTIPETGARALLVGSYSTRIIGWPLEKGRALLQELLEWSTQPRFVYRHQWRAHDLVVWDNRCCLHRGRPWDRRIHPRVMHRTTVAGDGPTHS